MELDREVLCTDGMTTCQVQERRESQPWNEITHLLERAERGQDDKADAPCIACTPSSAPFKSSIEGSVFECSSSSHSSTQRSSEAAAVGSKAEAKATHKGPDHALDLVTMMAARSVVASVGFSWTEKLP